MVVRRKRKYSYDQFKEWAEEYKICGSLKAVAKKFNVPASSVGTWLRAYENELGIQLKRQSKKTKKITSDLKNSPYTIENIEEWANKYKEVGSFVGVASFFGVDRGTIRQWLRKYKDKFGLKFKCDLYGVETETTKVCTQCEEEKDKSEFVANRQNCKECVSRYARPEVWEERDRNLDGYKTCCECNEVKPFNDFRTNKKNKWHGRSFMCKECSKIYRKNRIENKEEPDITEKKCIGKYGCGEIKPVSEFDYLPSKKAYAPYCKSCRRKKWHEVDKKKIPLKTRLAGNLRARLRMAFKSGQKTGSAVKDLGCSIEELKKRFESMFYPNPETGEMMTWENYGKFGWNIDHIKPLASFDLTDRKQFLEACHYTNLQPMWWKENFKKHARISEEFGNAD